MSGVVDDLIQPLWYVESLYIYSPVSHILYASVYYITTLSRRNIPSENMYMID